MTKHISLTETAQLIRETLKVEFPGVKFSVRSKSFANGSSVDVQWVDGPTWKDVDGAISFYSGSTFDGMQDLSSPKYHHTEGGEVIQYGAKYVQAQRSFSAEFLQHMADYATATYAFTAEPEFQIIPASKYSTAHIEAKNTTARFGNDWAANFVYQLCHKTDAANLPAIPVAQPEAVAETVTVVEQVAVEVAEIVEVPPVVAKLQSIDILNVTPLEALNILAELKKLAS